MKQPLVSIVTPSYNQGRFIRETITSVLNQDYPNIEYIIMDGGSTDETASVAQEFRRRLTFISEKDRGQAHAINKGFKLATGEIFFWLNSDDVILPGAVTRVVRSFEERPNLGAVYGEGYLIDLLGNIKSRFPTTEPFNLWRLIYLWDPILQQTAYFRRTVIEEIGLLDESLYWGLDWDLLIRIGKRYPIQYIPEFLGCLREYDEAKSFSGGHRRFRELVRVMRAHAGVRYPPAYFYYGIDTYQNIISRYIPIRRARHAIFKLACNLIIYISREAQGLYNDGWASNSLHYMLPASKGQKNIRIVGSLPACSPLEKQDLEVICDGALIARARIPFGDFQIDIAPKACAVDLPVRIEVKASKVFVPIKHGLSTDDRKLAFILKTIEWADTAPEQGRSSPRA
jgi:glycosyltransferase involved in cell wall biosynthesis